MIRNALATLLAGVAFVAVAPSAQAQIFRAYLASDGLDANPCTLSQPCRLLPAALTAVTSGGEIWMLDSANYNTATLNVTKSVTILAVPGVVGSVVATGGGPAISITTAGLNVALRNLVVVPLPGGGGNHGVQMQAASTLTIEECRFANLPGNGIFVVGSGKLRLVNSTLRGGAGMGLWLQDGARADVSGSQLLDNGDTGIFVFSNSTVATTATVSDSILSGNQVGINAVATVSNGVARALVTRSSIQSGNIGIRAEAQFPGASAIVTIGSSMITNNATAYFAGSGTPAILQSMGNNQITDNGGTNGFLTPTALQ